jgi:hypothetical protein
MQRIKYFIFFKNLLLNQQAVLSTKNSFFYRFETGFRTNPKGEKTYFKINNRIIQFQ